MGSSTQMDMGGLDIVCNGLYIGATAPGQAGTNLSSTELALLDTVSATSGVVASKAIIANSSGFVPYKPNVIRHTTGATLTLTAAQSGGYVYLDKADGVTITLPATAIGLMYRFIVVTDVTSVGYKISTSVQNTEFFDGTYNSLDIDGTGVVGVVFAANGSTHDNMTMNGTTTGGLAGTELCMTCTAANKWTVSGFNRASGTVATAFATT